MLVVLQILVQLLSKGFCMFEVFSIRSALIHPTKPFHETIGDKTFTLKFINNQVAFRLQLAVLNQEIINSVTVQLLHVADEAGFPVLRRVEETYLSESKVRNYSRARRL